MKIIRWGIIGAGNVTEVKSGPALQKAEHSALVAVMRRNGELARDYAERHGVPKWYNDADALINDPEVDAVYIATPPNAHKDYTLRCAKVGKPVYVEKPMAINFAECQEMIEACRAADVPLFVAFYRRMLPRFLKIKSIIDSGVIGTVQSVNIRFFRPAHAEKWVAGALPWRVLPEQAGGGLFVDLGSHMLDFLDYALGPIRAVQGTAINRGDYYPAEDNVAAQFEFESGALGVGQWSFTSFEDVDETEIIGPMGQISYSTFGATPIKLTTQHGTEEFDILNPLHIQQPLIQSIVNELNGVGHCPSTGESAARTTRVMDSILASYYTRGS